MPVAIACSLNPSDALPPSHPAVSGQEVKRLSDCWILTQILHHAPRARPPRLRLHWRRAPNGILLCENPATAPVTNFLSKCLFSAIVCVAAKLGMSRSCKLGTSHSPLLSDAGERAWADYDGQAQSAADQSSVEGCRGPHDDGFEQGGDAVAWGLGRQFANRLQLC